MIKYVHLADDGRIAATADALIVDGMFQFNFPENFDFTEQYNYKIVSGDLMHNPLPAQGQDHIDISGLREDVDYLLIAEMTREGLL